ncbi:hypothetical protein ACFFRR_008507 [Megaselia abdita]
MKTVIIIGLLISVVNAQVGCVDDDTDTICETGYKRIAVLDDETCTKYRICGYNMETKKYSIEKLCSCPPPSQFERNTNRCVLLEKRYTLDYVTDCVYNPFII